MKSTELPTSKQKSIFETGETPNPIDEIILLLSEICPEIDSEIVIKIHNDVAAIFSGSYPGFQASITKYHNLRHTYSVVLASMRLFHSLFHEERTLPPDLIFQGLISAYFHDTGMLLLVTDTAKTGANYTKYHEKRSTVILEEYLKNNNFPENFKDNCTTIIKLTNLDSQKEDFNIDDGQLKLCCQVICSADLLAQMADRYYLESLPLLYQEHMDGGIGEHRSALDLMKNTIDFHQNIIKKRLTETLGNIAPAMRTHFRVRWDIDKNLYLHNIDLNIEYLKKIIHACTMDLSCWAKYLRRQPPKTP